jgi:cytochrome oxidase Cu insertion factor (SCO1/SenC/PrrC family)
MLKHLLALSMVCLVAACSEDPRQMLVKSTFPAAYGPVPDFSLTESSGRTLTRDDLRGKVWVADFIFTRCAGTCPSMTGRMRQMQDTLPSEINLISFTVDPDRDTPQVLAEYAKHYGAEGQRWLFVTGKKDELFKLSIEGFKLGVTDTGGTEIEPIMHSTRFVLVDKEGQIRGYYGNTEVEELKRLTEDAKRLL